MKNQCLWGVDIEFKMFMQKVKSLQKQTTPLQLCTAHSIIHRRVDKWPMFDPNHGQTPLEKCQFLELLNFLFLLPRKEFFRYRI